MKGKDEIQAGMNPKGVIWLHVPELRDGHADRRRYLSGVATTCVTEVAKKLGKPIALEALDFGQRLERGKGAKTLSRLASQFNHGQVISAIERRAQKEETGTVKVKPAFTSVIGSVKYQKQLGLSVHESAALTIGRRALGYRERVHRSSRTRVLELLFHLRSGVAQSPKAVPMEGTRRAVVGQAKGVLGRLTVRAIRKHNGARGRWVDRWRKGLWGNVKEAQNLVRRLNAGWSGDTENTGGASAP